MPIADVLRRHRAGRPDHPALRWSGGQWTYAELDTRANQVAHALRAAGVGRGDRVAFLDRNGPEQLEVFFAAAKLGAVQATLNFRLTAAEVAPLVADTEAPVWVVGAEFADLAAEVTADLADPPRVIATGAEYEAVVGGQPEADPDVAVGEDEVVYQLYSSGTTGRPKGVELTNANLANSLGIYHDLMGLDGDAVNLVPLPMFHVGGGAWALAAHVVGATNVLVREPDPAHLLEVIATERVTHAALVPALMKVLLDKADGPEVFRSLQGVLYGASPIPGRLLTDLLAGFGCEFFQAYGLTETTGTVVVLPAADHDPDGPNRHRLRSCGLPVTGTEVRIADTATLDDVPAGQVGEILFRGKNIMHGYWKQPELTAESIVDGWFRSGDIGYRDEDGYLYLHDRVKDMIISGGENVYPAEIEDVLAGHGAVADVAVIGVPHDKWGETPKALVVQAEEVTEDTLIAHCRQRLPGYKTPTSVEFRDTLPRTPTGKLLKKDLRAPYWKDHERAI